jgi:hypothetical protein
MKGGDGMVEIGYGRVCTEDQAPEGVYLDFQEEKTRAYRVVRTGDEILLTTNIRYR